MRCASCQSDNPPDNTFCEQCGSRLEMRCPECQAPVGAGARFCGKCGRPLAPSPASATPAPADAASARGAHAVGAGVAEIADSRQRRLADYTPKHLADKILKSRSALEGERRQVTVLFADIAGFTTLAEHLDPEDVHAIVNRCFELITAEVHRFEGTINQYTGDGVMALFGAPIAHEDSARRAVHAALAVQRALRDYARDLQQQRGLALLMRIGLNTGPVVVGRIGDDLRMDYTAVGDTTNLAARMQQIARPGSVTMSEATYQATAGFFETLELGEVAVKGHRPVQAWEVLRPRGGRSRLDIAAERGLTPLVGREREVATLVERFADVKAGRGQVVCVAGEAGIGKSRLLLEFRRRLAEAGENVTWLEGQCVSFGQSIAFLPLIDQLRRNFGIEERDGEPEIIAKIEHGMRRMGHIEAHIPYVRYLLSVDPGDPAVATMNPLGRRGKVFEAIRALIMRGAAIRPVVLVFEDLHWVDASTEEYLGGAIDTAAATSLMLALTYRIGYTPPFRPRSFQTTVTLQTLPDDQALAMAAQVLGSAEFPADVKAALMQKAGGVPLFIEEVAKTLVDLGVLRREAGGLRLVRGLTDVSVPDTIQGIIMARLDRLGDAGKRTVQLAAVIGRRFLVRLLDRISGTTEGLDGLLAELRALEIIVEQGLLDEPAYVFRHAVIQDVAYDSLLRDRRRELHCAVGRAIEELFADRLAEHYEELAHHFTAGGEWPQAFEYLVRSGDRAKDAYANQAALDFYARALDVAERAGAVAPRRLADIRRKRAQVLLVLARPADAAIEATVMLEIACAAGDREIEAEALTERAQANFATHEAEKMPEVRGDAGRALALAADTGNRRLQARALAIVGASHQSDGQLAEADGHFRESLAVAESAGLGDAVAQTVAFLGASANWRGDFPHAVVFSRRARDASARLHDGFTELLASSFECLAHIAIGDYGDAVGVIEDGLVKARDRKNGFFEGRLLNSLGWLHQELGDFVRAKELDLESQAIGQRIPNGANVEISAAINLGLDLLSLGEPARAVGHLADMQERARKVGVGSHRWRWPIHIAAYLAEALLAVRRAEDARLEIETALVQARATGSMKYVGRAHALRGAIALAAGDAAAAERDLREAVAIARRIAYPTLTWQAAHTLADALARQDKREEAFEAARLAADTIAFVATRAPDDALRRAFRGWERVAAVDATLDRLTRG